MSVVDAPTPPRPPPPPPPPPSGSPARPDIDPALLRPGRGWYWFAFAVGGAALIVSTVLSMFNTFDNLGGDPDLQISLISWLLYFVGVGLAATIGGVVWSRRSEHKRRLQYEEMVRQGLV